MKYWIFILSFLATSSASAAIYNLKTHDKGEPKEAFSKYWLLVAEGCSSCDQVLDELKAFCSGKKPSSGKISFFVTGQNEQKMLKKLNDYTDYDIFSGSPDEFYTTYGFQGSPALLMKQKGKITAGKTGILTTLKKDKQFCI